MLPALASEELQELLDCVLFEPGEWSAVDPPVPTCVPAPDRAGLATPARLLPMRPPGNVRRRKCV